MGNEVKISSNGECYLRLKTNLTIWVFYSLDSFQVHINQELSKCENLSFEMIPLNGVTISNLTHLPQPDLIFVEAGPNWAKKITELQQFEGPEFHDVGRDASLIVFGNENDSGALKIALRVGASDFISDKALLDELAPLLKNIAEAKVANYHLGELLVFMNTKGGSGASMIALHTGVMLARQYPNKVLLLDLDMQFGAIEDYLNIDESHQYGLADLLAKVDDLDKMSLTSLVTKHESGLHIIGFKRENSKDSYDKAEHLNRLIPILLEHYPYVVVDMSRGLERIFSSVISPATKIFLVSQQSLVALKNASQLMKLLVLEFGVAREQIEVIVNRYEKRRSTSLKDVVNIIGNVRVHTIPNDFKVARESANLGRPCIRVKHNSSIAKSVKRKITSLILGKEEPASWYKKLFS
ncbi:AAA family ATPase [Vibrio sp. Of14-4]|uniref:AAA family ATPase n=1 Tax=Vibrio sp. Of14-4 TaxID=2724878 RepID=UPI001EF27E85|nr:AAA family ATPase [Vibrio sp. Of14-4]MCG7489903.1 AAA family ATPase [Vibrio sp. Of14-4]